MAAPAARSSDVHDAADEPAGRTPLSKIKLMKDDPAAVDKQVEQIKQQYLKYFKT